MSWAAYLDSLCPAGGPKDAGIYGHNGAVWTASAGMSGVTAAEVAALIAGFNNPSGLFATGFKVSNVKYFTIRADEELIQGKKGQGGVVVIKTVQAILIGVYDENCTPGNATTIVGRCADHLKEAGY